MFRKHLFNSTILLKTFKLKDLNKEHYYYFTIELILFSEIFQKPHILFLFDTDLTGSNGPLYMKQNFPKGNNIFR